ncbi:MAG: glycyl-radical enzyme activating protein [Anaerolineaceae bacterium]
MSSGASSSMNDANPAGVVLEIQRMSTEDGPGLRTTVFMKGCPMRCLWCHNPESISAKPQPQWIGSRCMGCKTCLAACPNGALSLTEAGMLIDRSVCQGCGACAEACPTTAMELMGKTWQADALARELLKDRAYFEQSGGGITISGGESTLQAHFVTALLRELKAAGIHTAIDTCGVVMPRVLDAILPQTDLVLYDLKEMDPRRHLEYTGRKLEQVLETLSYIVDTMREAGQPKEMWIRTPLIPQATARLGNVMQIGSLIAGRCDGAVTRWDLLAFNNLCKDKYLRLGQIWPLQDTPLLTRAEMETLAEAARNSGVDARIVQWSGTTRLEEQHVG